MTKPNLNNILDQLRQESLRLLDPFEQEIFCQRVEQHWDDVLRPLSRLYADHPNWHTWLHKFLDIAAHAYATRSPDLRLLDQRRLNQPDWFQQAHMIGYVAYTDRFSPDGKLTGIAAQIPYLQELGVTYLHLMPLLAPRPGPNDGGYAVVDYRRTNARLGTMADLAALATRLRQHHISLCIDLVCNHTAKEHDWAQKARAGDLDYLDYYLTFPDRVMPDHYELTTPEIFPDWAPGNFTYYADMDRWVWTTFNEYQWDLNYANPAVFGEMLDIILFLANQGVEVMRLDAVAFMWKRLGTDSQNQPEAHAILQAWRALTRIAAPALILKAEAIVSPDKLIPYLGRGRAANKECELAYHNVFMVLLWSALAEQKVVLMTYALQQMPAIPSGCAWNTYVRCHDDIGWAVRDEDAGAIGLNGFWHRSFLSDFYSGRFPNSYARGATFQFNPKTNDRRISGSCASLAGLEAALAQGNVVQIDLAVRRILLLHSMMLAFGGIPLLYMGDELGMLNDYTFADDPDRADDNRWMHRPRMDWEVAARRGEKTAVSGRIFQHLTAQIAARKRTPALHAQAQTQPVWTHNDQVFGLVRESARGQVLVLGNFTAQFQLVSRQRLAELGFYGALVNLLDEAVLIDGPDIYLEPYGHLWLARVGSEADPRL